MEADERRDSFEETRRRGWILLLINPPAQECDRGVPVVQRFVRLTVPARQPPCTQRIGRAVMLTLKLWNGLACVMQTDPATKELTCRTLIV